MLDVAQLRARNEQLEAEILLLRQARGCSSGQGCGRGGSSFQDDGGPYEDVRVYSSGDEHTWMAGLAPGLVGGLMFGSFIGMVDTGATAETHVLYGVAAGFCGFGIFGYVSQRLTANDYARYAMEALVVAGWIAGAVFWGMAAASEGAGVDAGVVSTAAYSSFLLFFLPSPVVFCCLCWDNLDWHTLRLLSKQIQFQLVLLLTVYVMVMDAWRRVARFGSGWCEWTSGGCMAPLQAVCTSATIFSPLLIIMFLDSVKKTSRLFRLVLPFAYVAYVIVWCAITGFVYRPTPITDGKHDDFLIAAGTFEFHLSNALLTLLCIMATFIVATVRDWSGDTVAFPVEVAQIEKRAVPLIVDAGGLMRATLKEAHTVPACEHCGSGALAHKPQVVLVQI